MFAALISLFLSFTFSTFNAIHLSEVTVSFSRHSLVFSLLFFLLFWSSGVTSFLIPKHVTGAGTF